MRKEQLTKLRKKCFNVTKSVPFWFDKEVFVVDIQEVELIANHERAYIEKLEKTLNKRKHIKCPECGSFSEYLVELEGFGCSNEDCGYTLCVV